jgi:hypothetical protein
MTKNRYWDHERCAWVTYEAEAAHETVIAEALPEQRADEETADLPSA